MKYNYLFSPLKVNNMMLRNRIVCAPMGIIGNHKIISSTNYGAMSAWDRSMGGSALVHIPDECVDIFTKYEMDSTKECINVAKQDGAKVSCEIGFFSLMPDEEGYVYGPMDGVRFDKLKMKAYTKEKMQETIDGLVQTCLHAKKAGFDCITLHFGHDSLGSQFLSPVWNKREDEYGGSLENRCRFPKEALEAVRKAVGKDYPLILRISRHLRVEESYEEEDMLYFLKQVDNLVDMVNISCGMDVYYKANVYAVPTIFTPHNYNADFAKKVKESTNLLVCLVGAVMDYVEANQLIKDGYCDCCMFGRSLIADPYWPKKLLNGQEEDIVPCIRCMHCYHIATQHWNVQCSVNPRFRRENRLTMSQPIKTRKKHIVVIGGGPAGMVAALSAQENGHQVTLIEKENRLGGLLYWASQGPYKEDLKRYYNYLVNQVNTSSIQVILNTTPTKEFIQELKPDRLIIAIGSDSRKLSIIGNEYMMDCLDAIEKKENIGKKVIIVGGGSVGCELGLELANDNHEVTILEQGKELATNGNILYKIALDQYIKHPNIKIMTQT
ncbi:MAG: FAD-dependent oxidoreductase, partial [Traorella sp.]